MSKQDEKVFLTLVRQEGTDGKISCNIRTEPFQNPGQFDLEQNAIEFEDYLPKEEQVTFQHGENRKVISVLLISEKAKFIHDLIKDEDDEDEEDRNEMPDVKFNVKISAIESELEKRQSPPLIPLSRDEPHAEPIDSQSEKKHNVPLISKKKCNCVVTILQNDDVDDIEAQHEKLLQYFFSNRQASWSQQFKNAVLLGPQIDEDNLILEEVTLSEALLHFLTMFWKVLFAIVPPSNMKGGVPTFFVALTFIGVITAIVGEVATILGCVLGIQPSVTAITLVALGTSLPDTFASVTAAKTSKYADSAVGNITGSNSVNVFLGLGLPWVIAAHYNKSLG